ncbi:MAG: hypothetical protein H9W81_17245 [Enterococcus sp.]|nr:hypothetical protein [Enterococcus sp.]
MSRTYKDRPYWVLEQDKRAREEHHDHTKLGTGTKTYRNVRGGVSNYYHPDECSIEMDRQVHPSTDRWEYYPCYYYVSSGTVKRYYRDYSPPRDTLHDLYWGPMRADVRDGLNDAIKEYNTHGDIEEDIFFREKNRHSTYGGGYWD